LIRAAADYHACRDEIASADAVTPKNPFEYYLLVVILGI
jgi:hypothetical protein